MKNIHYARALEFLTSDAQLVKLQCPIEERAQLLSLVIACAVAESPDEGSSERQTALESIRDELEHAFDPETPMARMRNAVAFAHGTAERVVGPRPGLSNGPERTTEGLRK
jgi:hypothetical protein